MSEENLKQYWGEKVKIVSNDDETVIGVAAYYTCAADSDTEEESITIEKNFNKNQLVEVMASEIKSIEVIND